jgi:methylated-DNA-[protein]-cysteine S-methyltransferase
MRNIKSSIFKEMSRYPLFYRKVWKACALIPYGETRTYGWIAAAIGMPRSWRAVGSALGKNPFAPDIPCHRVIRADGTAGGYSGPGGIARKKRLLRREQKKKPSP